ncbi:hypothetical protein [Candidatus Chloroploca sp. Khr17]|uniref:hypothetical protein n=1 Tax=Candidatus Chloroploca sp. Khr17 TaxID=2496869 RepID=UPI00101C9C83|nr:hypothetical protein [Candidatus Chloroploca sp. Khr17]
MAETASNLATSPEVAGMSGKHVVTCRAVPPSHATYDQALVRRLWDLSAQLGGLNTLHTP